MSGHSKLYCVFENVIYPHHPRSFATMSYVMRKKRKMAYLHTAASLGAVGCVKALIEFGAQVNEALALTNGINADIQCKTQPHPFAFELHHCFVRYADQAKKPISRES